MIENDAASVLEGTLIDGQFRICHRLGEGGMGTVWAAEDLQLDRMVAAKFLWQHMASDPRVRQRFQREARMTARVRSPHVVQVFAQGCTRDDVPYMIMELLDGEDLSAYLRRCGRCGLRETAEIVLQVCRGLACAHAEGLVHRDIKPHNVFLTHDDARVHVKLLDFGIAKDLASLRDSLTACGEVVGSALYSSPEQLRDSQSVNRATDIWALAIVIYEMLTGVVPFAANSFAELIELHGEGRFASPTDLAPELPRGLDAFFERALHADPSERFASVEALAEAFTAIARSAPDVASGGGVARTVESSLSNTVRGSSIGYGGRARWALAVLAMGVIGFALARAWTGGPAPASAAKAQRARSSAAAMQLMAADAVPPTQTAMQREHAHAPEQVARSGASERGQLTTAVGAERREMPAAPGPAARSPHVRVAAHPSPPDRKGTPRTPSAESEAMRKSSTEDQGSRAPEQAAPRVAPAAARGSELPGRNHGF